MKFFVYKMGTNKRSDERRLAFIDEGRMSEFTLSVYKPEMFDFTGICIEAPSLNVARQIYAKPTECPEECEYMLSDEPQMTVAMRLVSSQQKKLGKISTTVAQHTMVYHIRQISIAMSHTARTIHAGSNGIMTPEQIFEALRSKVASTIASLPYERPEKGGTESGPDGPPTAGSPA